MRYYCKNCESEIRTEQFIPENKCAFCGSGKLLIIPDYETPAQYEKRVGKPYPDNGLVWHFFIPLLEWYGRTLYRAQKEADNDLCFQYGHIIIADPSVPPPEGWKPEDVKNVG